MKIGLLVVAVVFAGCGAAATPAVRGKQMATEVLAGPVAAAADEQPSKVIDFRELVPGLWDRVYRFGGYSTGEAVSRRLGHDWGEGHAHEEIAYEGESALVFTRGTEVVAWIGHFSDASVDCVRRRGAGARFRFLAREWIESDGRPYRLLVPVTSKGLDSAQAQNCVAAHGPGAP